MKDLSAEEWDCINEVSLWIHAQTDIEVLQRGILDRLFKLIAHETSFFDLCCVSDGRLVFFNPVSTTMTDENLSDYYQNYELSDYVAWCFTAAEPIIYRDSDMISDDARERSVIYREWMKPIGIHYSMGSTVVDQGIIFGSITLFRNQDFPDFSDKDMAILSVINRHLAVHFSLLCPRGVYPDDHRENIENLALASQLSEREVEVMRLVAEGYTNQKVGSMLFISESTVKKHLNTVYKKLGVENRIQLMRLVVQRNTTMQPFDQ